MATHMNEVVVSTKHSEHHFKIGTGGVSDIFYATGGLGVKVWIKNSDKAKERIFFGDVQMEIIGGTRDA